MGLNRSKIHKFQALWILPTAFLISSYVMNSSLIAERHVGMTKKSHTGMIIKLARFHLTKKIKL
ncbi:MAG: hypothetical protein C0433_10775 [Cyclobacterium sp.]|nr:hypothetical protein [Cyclobacterium sp.]